MYLTTISKKNQTLELYKSGGACNRNLSASLFNSTKGSSTVTSCFTHFNELVQTVNNIL